MKWIIILMLGFLSFFSAPPKYTIDIEQIKKEKKGVRKKQIIQNYLDEIKINFRQYKLEKCANIIYQLEPLLDENSYEMGVLVVYKSILYEIIDNHENYIKQANRLEKISKNIKEKNQRAYIKCFVYMNVVTDFFDKGDKEGQYKYCKKIYDTLGNFKAVDDYYYYLRGRALILIANAYIEKANYPTASRYTEMAKSVFSQSQDDFFLNYYYYTKGLIEAKQKNPNKAVPYYFQNLNLATKYNARRTLYDVYPMISTAYINTDPELSAKYYLKYKVLGDSLSLERKKTEQFIEKQDEITTQNTEVKEWIVLGVFLALVAAVAYYFYKRRLLKSKLKIKELYQLLEKENYLQDKYSENEIQELVHLSQKNESAFYLSFQQLFSHLYETLITHEPKFSESEIKLIMYLKMKYTIKEIAIHTNTTAKSVESKKYRIRKKINVESDTELIEFISLN